MEIKYDPHKNKEKWIKWKERNKNGIKGISEYNSKILLQYIKDMELGINVSTTNKRGPRSPQRLNGLKYRVIFLMKQFEKRYKLDKVTDLTDEQLIEFFAMMRNGEFRKANGEKYQSVQDYAKSFKAFWHWWQRVNRKQDIQIKDITIDLDSSGEKPRWVYLDENQIKLLYENANFKYKTLIMFLFDSGIRSPTELMNVRVADLYNDFKELHIRDEVSKTFGRRIKLMICSETLKEYVKSNGFKENDYVFRGSAQSMNLYLKRLGKRVLGDKMSLAGQKYSQLTMYDFRHCSCCYWLPRYKSESALKFRFGWKKSDKIHYYSELLGMRDTISEDDLLIDVTKTEIEKRLTKAENENKIIRDENEQIKLQMKKILMMVNQAREVIVSEV
jgi:integrase